MKNRTLPLLLLPFALTGCVSFGAKVPPQLLRLSPTTAAPASAGQVLGKGLAVAISYPTTPVELANNRVPVRLGATEIAYVKNAQWLDVPGHLFRDLLAETVTVRTGRPTLTPREASLGQGSSLGGRLTEFGIDAAGNQAAVVFDATLVRASQQVETRRFTATAPVSGAVTETSAGAAINVAANDVATQVADWIGR